MTPDAPLRTAADDLIDLLKKESKLPIEDVAKKLKLPMGSVQSIVDFLVEERVLGIEYKFTTPYIYINEDWNSHSPQSQKSLQSKEQFYEKLREGGMPPDRISLMWNEYLKQNLPQLKPLFISKAIAKGASKDAAEELWQKYQSYIR